MMKIEGLANNQTRMPFHPAVFFITAENLLTNSITVFFGLKKNRLVNLISGWW